MKTNLISNIAPFFLVFLTFFSPQSVAENQTDTTSSIIKIGLSQRQALGIQTAHAEVVQTAWSTSFPAKIVVPNSQLRVVATPLSGLLESLNVSEGENVKEGQILARVHSHNLLEKQSDYLNALVELNLAQTEMERSKNLSEKGVIPTQRFQTSTANYHQLKTRATQYKQALALAGMSEQAINQLTRTQKLSPLLEIKAPLDGVVLEQMVTTGSQLEAIDPIYKVGYLKPLWLEIHVPLNKLGKTTKSTKVRIVSPSLIGRVITVGRMVHGTDQGVLVRAEINEGAEYLRPGQFVQAQIAQIEGEANLPLFRIPRSALVRHGGKTWIFTTTKDGIQVLPINIKKEETDALAVSGKLSHDTNIVVSGTAALKAIWLEDGE